MCSAAASSHVMCWSKGMRKRALVVVVLALSLQGFAADFGIGSFGAKADGRVQTQAIQSAIDAASAAGGGTVVVPRGTYVCGALFFRPGVNLRIDEGGVLKGSTEILDFPMMMTRIEGETRKYFPALVNADRCDGFRLTGKGAIDGSGGPYWKRLVIRWQSRGGCENIDEQRPRLVYVSNSTNVTVSGVTLRDSPFWTLHLYRCKDVLVENARIEAGTWEGVQNENADAIDFDGVRNVTVRGCSFDVHNDALTTKGGKGPLVHLPEKAPDAEPNDGLLVENCAFGPQCTGCLTLGSECFAAKNIIMRNCRVSNPTCVLRLKMRPDTRQVYSDVTVEGITGTCGNALVIAPYTAHARPDWRNQRLESVAENIRFVVGALVCRSGTSSVTPSTDYRLVNVRCE